jgi:hypothetical protein
MIQVISERCLAKLMPGGPGNRGAVSEAIHMDAMPGRDALPTFTGFAAYFANSASFISPGSWTVIPFFFEDSDPGNNFDPTTHRYTVPQTGLYMLGFSFQFDTLGGPAPTMVAAKLFANDAPLACGAAGSGSPAARNASYNLTVLVSLNAADAIDVRILLLTNGGYIHDPDAVFWGCPIP